MTSGAVLGASGEPHCVEHDGRTYRFGRLTRGVMDAFSTRLIRKQRERLAALYGDDQALLAGRLLALEREVLDGAYDFMEAMVSGTPSLAPEAREIDGASVPGFRAVSEGGAINTRSGQLLLVSILAGVDETEALALLVARPAEVGSVLRLTMAESFGSADGWAPATAAPQGGTPEGNARPPADPPA